MGQWLGHHTVCYDQQAVTGAERVRAQRAEDLVLRDFNFCVIDEVDSILVDEARTPLIISGNAERPSGRYYQVLLGVIRPQTSCVLPSCCITLAEVCCHAFLPLQRSAAGTGCVI